ncbi:hypothetical protein D3C72_1739550 [compost metagenome]
MAPDHRNRSFHYNSLWYTAYRGQVVHKLVSPRLLLQGHEVQYQKRCAYHSKFQYWEQKVQILFYRGVLFQSAQHLFGIPVEKPSP